MGQGRKKLSRSCHNASRKRSITLENDTQPPAELMMYIGPVAVMRNHYVNSIARNRDPTPFPGSRHLTTIPLIPAKKDDQSANASPTNVLFDAESVPLVSTTPITKQDAEASTGEYYNLAVMIVDSLFTETTILQNNRRREITTETRESLDRAMEALLGRMHDITTACVAVYFDGDELVRQLFTPQLSFILHDLVYQCRFERIYGLSIHIAFIDRIQAVIPAARNLLQRVLYEALLDFSESERNSTTAVEDDLYVKETPYGQVHRLVELWSACVSVDPNCGGHT